MAKPDVCQWRYAPKPSKHCPCPTCSRIFRALAACRGLA